MTRVAPEHVPASGDEPEEAPRDRMMRMITGYWISQIVHGAARISLAECLHTGAKTSAEIAAAADIDPDAAFRFLRACAGLGLVAHDGRCLFSATPLLNTLRNDNPHSLKGMALTQAAPSHWLPWGRFTDALKTGESQAKAALGVEFFDYLGQTPAEAEAFTESMRGLTASVSEEVASILDMTGVSCAVDIGGGSGTLLFPLIKANPALRGVVFELPTIVPSAEKAAAEAGLSERLTVTGGDFFASVPPADLYLLKYILHDWDDEACVKILRNCREAMNPGGRIAIIELVIGEIGESGPAPLLDLNMLVLMRGRERSLGEYRRLLQAAGFGTVKVMRTNTPMTLLEAAIA